MTEEEQKAIEKLEIEGTENNYLEVKIVLDLIDKQQETLRKQSYTNKKLRNKIKTVRKERDKLQSDIEIKDKVIEKTCRYINEAKIMNKAIPVYPNKVDTPYTVGVASIEEIKQHFYKQVEKVEEENE